MFRRPGLPPSDRHFHRLSTRGHYTFGRRNRTPWHPIDEKYDEIDQLDVMGCFNAGVVVVQRRSDGLLAIKKMMTAGRGDTVSRAVKEMTVLKKLRHPNILKFLNGWTDGLNSCLYTEMCDAGNLESHINLMHRRG